MKHMRWIWPLLFSPLAAMACQFEHLTQEEVFTRAKSVFRARIVDVRLGKFANPSFPGSKPTSPCFVYVEGVFGADARIGQIDCDVESQGRATHAAKNLM